MLPYLVAEGLMLAGAIALAAAPETVARPDRRPRYHPQRVQIPAGQRRAFYAAGLAAAAAFALFGLFTSLAPGFIIGILHQSSHALAGLSTFIVFGAAALAQMSAGRLPLSRGLQARLGLGVLAAGVAAVTAAVWLPSLALFLVGGAIAGAGAAFKTSITTVLSIAPAGARGETLSGLFVAAYLGLTVPRRGPGDRYPAGHDEGSDPRVRRRSDRRGRGGQPQARRCAGLTDRTRGGRLTLRPGGWRPRISGSGDPWSPG